MLGYTAHTWRVNLLMDSVGLNSLHMESFNLLMDSVGLNSPHLESEH